MCFRFYPLTLYFKVLFMKDNISNNPLAALQEIKKVMQQSSRIFSLSGWSGVWAGVAGLAGACWFGFIKNNYGSQVEYNQTSISNAASQEEQQAFYEQAQRFFLDTAQKELLLWSAVALFVVAVLGAFFFSYRKNARQGFNGTYNQVARKLLINLAIPMFAGFVFCLHFLQYDGIAYLVPVSLVFYGLALINCSKYTFSDIKYLGLLEVLLGLAALVLMKWHLWIWGLGFGVLHIVYGILMWYKYDRK